MPSLKAPVAAALRRGLVHGIWTAAFLVPLAFFEYGSSGALAGLGLSALPLGFGLFDVFTEAVLAPYNERMRVRLGDPPPRPTRKLTASPFVATLILSLCSFSRPQLMSSFPASGATLSTARHFSASSYVA